jgi:hypothetical protein
MWLEEHIACMFIISLHTIFHRIISSGSLAIAEELKTKYRYNAVVGARGSATATSRKIADSIHDEVIIFFK